MHGQQAGEGGEAYIIAAGFAGTAGVKVFKQTEIYLLDRNIATSRLQAEPLTATRTRYAHHAHTMPTPFPSSPHRPSIRSYTRNLLTYHRA
jgi:hypothetical protein